MTQASSLIRSALLLIGVVDAKRTPVTIESDDALESLNNLIADWSASETLVLYSSLQLSYAPPGSLTSFTVGETGDVATVRPTRIRDMFVRANGLDYPIVQINRSDYESIGMKSFIGAWPSECWYDPTLDNGTVYLWPGATSGQTIFFTADQPLQQFMKATDTVAIPTNYKRALIYNLAVEIAPQYEMEASATVQRIAAVSLRNIKRLNTRPLNMQGEAWALSSKLRRYNRNNTDNIYYG